MFRLELSLKSQYAKYLQIQVAFNDLFKPFNHPLLIAVKKIAPALAAGNSIIVKPSELAPISVLAFAEMAQEAGGKFLYRRRNFITNEIEIASPKWCSLCASRIREDCRERTCFKSAHSQSGHHSESQITTALKSA